MAKGNGSSHSSRYLGFNDLDALSTKSNRDEQFFHQGMPKEEKKRIGSIVNKEDPLSVHDDVIFSES